MQAYADDVKDVPQRGLLVAREAVRRQRPRATISDVPGLLVGEQGPVIFLLAVVVALVLRQIVSGVGDAGIIARIDSRDAQTGEAVAIEGISAASFHAVLHVQKAIATQRIQTFVDHALATLLGSFRAEQELSGEKGDYDVLHFAGGLAGGGLVPSVSAVSPELIL